MKRYSRFLDQLLKMLNLHQIKKSTPLVVGCSGGVDSIALSCGLAKLGFRPQLIYIDHGQRNDTKKDQKVVYLLGKKFGLEVFVEKLKVKKNASENELRTLRYQKLFSYVPENGFLLTAHHADDQLETYLFRLLRGAHPQTISGISEIQENKLFRPLLGVFKTEILEFAKKEKLKWNEDSTNKSKKYARNRIRNELIPLLEELRSNSSRHLLEFFVELKQMQLKEEKKVAPGAEKNVDKIKSALKSSGFEIKKLEFFSFKKAVDSLLEEPECFTSTSVKKGSCRARTTKGQWTSVKNLVMQRKLTRNGEIKRIEFPGGHELLFEKEFLYWVKKGSKMCYSKGES